MATPLLHRYHIGMMGGPRSPGEAARAEARHGPWHLPAGRRKQAATRPARRRCRFRCYRVSMTVFMSSVT
jgi:hypothetical protein